MSEAEKSFFLRKPGIPVIPVIPRDQKAAEDIIDP
jgi:hypothetical protein